MTDSAKCHVMGKISSRNRAGGGRGGNLKDEGYNTQSETVRRRIGERRIERRKSKHARGRQSQFLEKVIGEDSC